MLIEVGNEQHDLFFFDLGSGSLANFNGLRLPVTSTTKVFISPPARRPRRRHADPAVEPRQEPVAVTRSRCGARQESDEQLGTVAYARHLEAAHAWDMESMCGHPGQSGARIIATEVPYDRTAVVYERNGVTISSFPVIHIHQRRGRLPARLRRAQRRVLRRHPARATHWSTPATAPTCSSTRPSRPPAVFAQKAGVPLALAEMIVNGAHTSPAMAGKVFERAGARMSAMWHLAVDHETVGPVFAEMRTEHDGPVVISQDLTVFNITEASVVARPLNSKQLDFKIISYKPP